MPSYRSTSSTLQAFILLAASSALLAPVAGQVMVRNNHDVQKVDVNRGMLARHDRAVGPTGATQRRSGDPAAD